MKAPRKRWVCPNCQSIKLAPSQPRKDDIRRYCLPCSEESGRLIARTAPALEKKRERKTAVRRERTKRQTAKRAAVRTEKKKERAARLSFRSPVTGKTVDARQEVKKIWRHARKIEPRLRETPPKIVVSSGWGSYAHLWPFEIHLGYSADWWTLVHEVAHFVRYKQGNEVRSDGKRAVHDQPFYQVCKDLAERLMPSGFRVSFYEVTRWGYGVDRIIDRQLWAYYAEHIKPRKEAA